MIARLLERHGDRVVFLRELDLSVEDAPAVVRYRGRTYARATAQRGGWTRDYRPTEVMELLEEDC